MKISKSWTETLQILCSSVPHSNSFIRSFSLCFYNR